MPIPEAVGTMQLQNLVDQVDQSMMMETLHDIQHVPWVLGCHITIVIVIQVIVRQLLILQR